VTLSPSGATICALDADGHPLCCGRNANKYPVLPGPFSDLAVSARGARDFGACGVKAAPTPAGATVECWGSTPVPPATFKVSGFIRQSFCGVTPAQDVACTSGATVPLPASARGKVREAAFMGNTTCALLATGQIACATRGASKVVDGTFSQIDVGAGAVCALDRRGRVSCWQTQTFSPLSLPLGDRSFRQIVVSTSGPDGLCGVTRAGTVQCVPFDSAHGALPVPDSSVQFNLITEGAGQFCGVTTSSHVECWGEQWPPVIRNYEARKPFGGLRPY
jgi:hypothetical protein